MSKKEHPTEEQFFDSGKVIKDGVEWPESTPVELPVGYQHPPTIQEMIALYVRNELNMREAMGDYSDDAAREEDYEVDEDGEVELLSPYELHYEAARAGLPPEGGSKVSGEAAAGKEPGSGVVQKEGGRDRPQDKEPVSGVVEKEGARDEA